MTEIQAAIGRIQLGKLPEWGRARRARMDRLFDRLSDIPALRIPRAPAHMQHAAYKAYTYIQPGMLNPGWTRNRIMTEIERAGVPCQSGSCSEIYREKAFQSAGWGPAEALPTAHELGETSLMFLVHPTLALDDMDECAARIRKVLEAATR